MLCIVVFAESRKNTKKRFKISFYLIENKYFKDF